jgi:hypothetical protein
MRIIYNNIIPFKGFSAMMLCGVIFARKTSQPLSQRTINHESIHAAQAKDCGGYLFFYLKYLIQWAKYGYQNCPFEREAYDNEKNLSYLEARQRCAWKGYAG